MEPKGAAAYISEFVGTFFLVLGICGVVSSGAGQAVLTNVALVHTLVLMSLVYAIGSISGCHVNPAVTVALAAIRKISGRDAGRYRTVMELDLRPLPPQSPVRGESAEPSLASAG
jgi:glycerol uptake facilitator-like aquaporin